jgi:hypothetical protein
MIVAVESARADWEAGYRRFLEATRDVGRADGLHRQLDEVTAELRRRLGAVYTLVELASVYAASDVWARATVADRAPVDGWERSVTTVADAAFFLFSRGAADYTP